MHAPNSAVEEYATRARVATDDASRYLQLCKHFRGKLPVEFDRGHGTIAVAKHLVQFDRHDRLVLDWVEA